MFAIIVKARIKTMGYKLLAIVLMPSPDSRTTAAVASMTRASASKLDALKIPTMYKIMQTSLNRGSSLWITEFPGKYCPNVMSESIRCSFRGVYRRILWFNYKLYHYFLNSYTFFWKQCFADGQRGFFMQKTRKNAKNSKYVYQFRVLCGIIPLYRYLYWGFCGICLCAS